MPSLHAIPGLWTPIEGYARLERFLRKRRFGLVEDRPEHPDAPPGNLIPFPYDWRLSNRWTAELLKLRVEDALEIWRDSSPERKDAKVVFVCHSMGGLVARWYVERMEGWKVTRSLVTLGTPHRGALKGLVQLVNGVTKGPGPLKIDLTRFARSLPSAYQLLPEYACIEGGSNELMKTSQVSFSQLDADRVRDGMAFYEELNGEATDYSLVPIVGIGQPTATTARFADDALEPLGTIAGREVGGDGTVPRLSARPKSMVERDPSIRGVVDGHGVLVGNRSVQDQLDFILTADDVIYKATQDRGETEDEPAMAISVPDLHEAGEKVRVSIFASTPRALEVVATDEAGKEIEADLVRFNGGSDANGRSLGSVAFDELSPGGYVIEVRAPEDPAGIEVSPVHTTTLVWEG